LLVDQPIRIRIGKTFRGLTDFKEWNLRPIERPIPTGHCPES
jgi:hypothetical protein